MRACGTSRRFVSPTLVTQYKLRCKWLRCPDLTSTRLGLYTHLSASLFTYTILTHPMSGSFHFLLAPHSEFSSDALIAFAMNANEGEMPTIDPRLLQEPCSQSHSPSPPHSSSRSSLSSLSASLASHPDGLTGSAGPSSRSTAVAPFIHAATRPASTQTGPTTIALSSHVHTSLTLTHKMDRAEAQRLCRGMDFAISPTGKFVCPVAGCATAYADRQSVVRHLWEDDVACRFCGKVVIRGNEASNMQRHQSTLRCQQMRREKEKREALEAKAASHSYTSRTRKRRRDDDEYDQDENEDAPPRTTKRIRTG